jgi:hypothetical protein
LLLAGALWLFAAVAAARLIDARRPTSGSTRLSGSPTASVPTPITAGPPSAVSVIVINAVGQWCNQPSEHGRPRPDLVVACPLTFNTTNKVTAGIMDSSAAGALCDALGAGVPVVVVPTVNNRHWEHPVWPSTLRTLAGAGVRFLDPQTGEVGEPSPD